jgi:hypothetical protein
LVSFSNTPEVRFLPSTGITRPPQYYEPVRHPRRPGLLLTEFRLRATTSHRWGFPCCGRFPFAHMPTPIPRRNRRVLIVLFPYDNGLPQIEGGSASAMLFRGLLSVHSRFGLHARQVAQGDPLHRSTSADSSPPPPLRLLPAGTTVAGWDSHPLKIAAFARHMAHPKKSDTQHRKYNPRNRAGRFAMDCSFRRVRCLSSSLVFA